MDCDHCGRTEELYWNDDYDGSLCETCDILATQIAEAVRAEVAFRISAAQTELEAALVA